MIPASDISSKSPAPVVVIGGGPAGLMAAELIATAGYTVDLYDAMPSVGRKFLLAGVGGMNITHAETFSAFVQRYGAAATWLEPMLRDFDAEALRTWAAGLGIETFVGSSGRVFPRDMKAAPLLRAWLHLWLYDRISDRTGLYRRAHRAHRGRRGGGDETDYRPRPVRQMKAVARS